MNSEMQIKGNLAREPSSVAPLNSNNHKFIGDSKADAASSPRETHTIFSHYREPHVDGSQFWQSRGVNIDGRTFLRVLPNNESFDPKPIQLPRKVKEAISKALKDKAEKTAEHVEVSSCDGKVTLTGKVNCWEERAEVARAAWDAPGVTQVINNILLEG